MLLDANLRKTDALTEAVAATGWSDRVAVVRARAETAARTELRGTFDLVVARSFGSPPVTAECAAGFLCLDGLLVVSEPPPELPNPTLGAGPSDPVRWPPEGLAALGLEPVAAWRHGFGFQVLRQAASCPEQFPRGEGVPKKHPIYRVR